MKFQEDVESPFSLLSNLKKQEKSFPGVFKLETLDDERTWVFSFPDYKIFKEQIEQSAARGT
jgi:hypothetical protein